MDMNCLKQPVWCAVLLSALCIGMPGLAVAENLVEDPGFENAAGPWGKYGNVDFYDWAKESGSFGVAFQGWVPNGGGGFFQSVKGVPGATYVFRIRARKEALFDATNVYMKLEFFQADDATKAGHDQGTVNIVSQLSEVWATFTITGMAPLGTAFVRPVFGFDGAMKGDLGQGKQACVLDSAELILAP
jgi:hypothetical protein